jgi:hypothetical protein
METNIQILNGIAYQKECVKLHKNSLIGSALVAD